MIVCGWVRGGGKALVGDEGLEPRGQRTSLLKEAAAGRLWREERAPARTNIPKSGKWG